MDPRQVRTIRALTRRGLALQDEGRYRESEPVLKKAVAVAEKVFGPEHPETATSLNNLAGLEHAAGNAARGEPFARRAVAIRTRARGDDHPEVAADQAALAAILDQQKKYGPALRLYRQALAIFERTFGPDHYEVAVNVNNIAAIRQAQGRLVEAEGLYRRSLAIKKRALGAHHPDVAVSLNNLAVLLRKRRRYSDSDRLFRRARAIFEKVYGTRHPNVAVCLENHARVLRRLNKLDEARACETRARLIHAGVDSLTGDGRGATATVNLACAGFALSIRQSTIHRWGLFTDDGIPAGRRVIEYTGERISRREACRRGARPRQYLFRLDDYWAVDGGVGGSGAEYANHSCEPNLFARCSRGRIHYISRRRIAPGEELTIDYSFSPDVPRVECRCGSAACRGTINVSRDQYKRWREQRRRRRPPA